MRSYIWIRQQRGKVFGLKRNSSPGYTITNWVARDKNGFWQIDGADMAGVVHGKFKTSKAAKAAVEERLNMAGKVCAQCGSPMVR